MTKRMEEVLEASKEIFELETQLMKTRERLQELLEAPAKRKPVVKKPAKKTSKTAKPKTTKNSPKKPRNRTSDERTFDGLTKVIQANSSGLTLTGFLDEYGGKVSRPEGRKALEKLVQQGKIKLKPATSTRGVKHDRLYSASL